MIVLIMIGLIFAYFIYKGMIRRRNANLMVSKPYVRELDSRRSRSGWKGGF
jgi:hypothetical protein